MNTNLNGSAVCYGLLERDNIIGFCSILHFPHPIVKNMKRVHRLVILPDYQGIGLGSAFCDYLAGFYKAKKFRFSIISSAKNLITAYKNSKQWKCTRFDIISLRSKSEDPKQKATHRKVKTASFEYIGKPIYVE